MTTKPVTNRKYADQEIPSLEVIIARIEALERQMNELQKARGAADVAALGMRT